MARKKSEPESVYKIVLLILAVIVLSSAATFALLHFFDTSPDEVKTVPYFFEVKDRVGLNLDADALRFGGGPPGSRLSRSINISTSEAADVRISWEGEGSMSASENDFYLPADTSKEVFFYADIPLDANPGMYEGVLIFSFYR